MSSFRLVPEIPIADDESFLSWINRLARIHTGQGSLFFLRDISVKAEAALNSDEKSLQKISNITGQSYKDLLNRAIIKTGARNRVFRGEKFSSEFAKEVGTSYCPSCLLADEAAPLHPFSPRVGRMMWGFELYRTCPIHFQPLEYRRFQIWSDRMRDMETIATSSELKDQALSKSQRPVSPLQEYMEKRFSGEQGPNWLDGQGIEQAVRATEILGAISMGNVNPNINGYTSDDWDHVGRVGYEITKGGKGDIYQALLDILKHGPRRKGGAQPQETFGLLYKWLAYDRGTKDRGPIKQLLFDFIVQELPMDANKLLLGKRVTVRTKHTVSSLYKQYGLHRQTLSRLLAMKGLLPIDALHKADGHTCFDAKEGEAIAAALSRSISRSKIPEYINTSRAQAEMLVKHGFLNPLHRNKEIPEQNFHRIDTDEIDLFMEKISSNAVAVSAVSNGMLSIPKAAEMTRVKTHEIVRFLLNGELENVESLIGLAGYFALFVDPKEIRCRFVG